MDSHYELDIAAAQRRAFLRSGPMGPEIIGR